MKLTAWLQLPVIRQMARQPLFSLLLIVTLGLFASGAGAATTVANTPTFEFGSSIWRVAELSVAIQNAAIDNESLQQWTGNLENNPYWGTPEESTALGEIADEFATALVLQDALTNREFINTVYRNLFDQDANQDALTYWLTSLEGNQITRGQMVVALIAGGFANTSPEAIADMERFKNRTAVALAFAQYQADHHIVYSQLDPQNQQLLIDAGEMILSNVTNNTATRDTAIASIPALLYPLQNDDPVQNYYQLSTWQVAGLFIAIKNAAIDNESLQHWAENLENDPSWGTPEETALAEIADEFATALDALTNGEFINTVYRNLFDQDADQDALNYWLTSLEGNQITRGQLVVTVIAGGFYNSSPEVAADMLRFLNRIAVAAAFAQYQADHGIVYSQLNSQNQQLLIDAGETILSNVTDNTATRDAAIASIPALLASVTAGFGDDERYSVSVVFSGTTGTLESNPAGIECRPALMCHYCAAVTVCNATFDAGTEVTLTAQSDMAFWIWEGDCNGTGGDCRLIMDQSHNVSVNFNSSTNTQQTLTVNAYGPGAVNSNPSGIACGSVCEKLFDAGEQVVLTAMPLTGGAVFSRWDGCANENGLTCTVTMNEAQNVTATFRYPTSLTQLIVSVLGEGQVISNPSGVNCDTALCFGGFTAGTEMKLTAQPETGWQFKEWQRGGACGGQTTAECQFTLNQTQTAIAVFEEAASVNQHELQAIIVGAGNITSQPSGSGIDCDRADNDAELTGTCVTNYTADQVVIFTATAEENAQFTGWGGVCADQGDTPICTVIIAELIASGENSSSIIASFGAIDRSNTTRWKVAELYMATMGYAMDAEGLNYWVNNIESGQLDSNGQPWTIDTVAQAFFNVDLVQAKYPTTLSNSEFIDEIYRNIFGRGADVDGRNYWLTELSERGTPRNAMIITVINGGWGNTSADAQSDMLRFKYRTEVALAFADYQNEHGIVYGALDAMNQQYLIAAGSNVLANVTQDETTRDAAIANIPNLLAPLHD
ncbi:DUF4214 domain-containing protein [Thiospirillum jenense]|uniref:DUF4214 domain-containing protein n=1 Tax=Thiospirillum jenense TaxID=1653858 RepID=A0A839HBY5_9GAMM|nr:DUF4214 domain-containing protein [Thiospirillum jenense]MBB1124727.1 DUF4214 domain-containing protein [Thiospirillum jenense]